MKPLVSTVLRIRVESRVSRSGLCSRSRRGKRIRRAGEDGARRGGARRRSHRARPRRAADGRAASRHRARLAYVLAQSRRFRIADDDRLATPGRDHRGPDRVAGAATAAGRAAGQLRLRRRRAPPVRAQGGAGTCHGCKRDAQGARRLARVPRDLHSRRRRPHARASGREERATGCEMESEDCGGAGRAAAAARGMEGHGAGIGPGDRVEARRAGRCAGSRRSAILSVRGKCRRAFRRAASRARRRRLRADASGREHVRRAPGTASKASSRPPADSAAECMPRPSMPLSAAPSRPARSPRLRRRRRSISHRRLRAKSG